MNIETNLATSMLLLNNEEIKKLQEFIGEFSKIKQDKKFSWVSFVDSVVSELKIVEYKGYLYHKHYVKVEYKDIINKYDKILRKLIHLEILLPIYRIISDEESKRQFIKFTNSILNNENNQSVMMENLSKMSELGIESFNYVPDNSLDNVYDMHIFQGPESGIYSVRGIASDGNKIWLPQEIDSKFEFFLEGANFLIEYKKNTLVRDNVSMMVKSLVFDPSSLPNREELYDSRVLPEIDYEEIAKKNEEREFLTSTKDISMYSKLLMVQLKKYIASYDKKYLSDKDVLELNDLINNSLSSLCLYISHLESRNLKEDNNNVLKKVRDK